MWIFIGEMNPQSRVNWININNLQDVGNIELYVNSFYFTVTTLLTVGYGDITAISVEEKILCIFLMIIGVVSFSFATGSLSSIMSNLDSKEAILKEKIAALNDIQSEYPI